MAAAVDLKFVDASPAKNEAYDPSSDLSPAPAGTTTTTEEENEGFFTRMKNKYYAAKAYKDDRLASLRPWSEFFDRSKFSVPGKLEAFSRINKNLSTFYSNYVVVTFFIALYVLFSNFLFLAATMFSFAAYYWVKMKTAAEEPLTIWGREFTPTQANGFLIVFGIFMFLYSNGSSTVFWLVTLALLAVFGHAASREPLEEAGGSAFGAVGNHVFV